MLVIPEGSSNIIKVIGLDPGSNTFGIAELDFNLDIMQIDKCSAFTITLDRMVEKNSWLEQQHSSRVARLQELYKFLLRFFNNVRPNIIASESPFINNKFPQSGIALTEVLSVIRQAVIDYNLWTTLDLLPPSVVKNGVGAAGAAAKDDMKVRLSRLTDLNYTSNVPLQMLDEHSIDALAVAYSRVKQL